MEFCFYLEKKLVRPKPEQPDRFRRPCCNMSNTAWILQAIKWLVRESKAYYGAMQYKYCQWCNEKYQKKLPSQFVCGSRGTCLESVLPGVQVTAGQGFSSAFKSFRSINSEDCDSYVNRPSLLCRSLVRKC